MPPPSSKAVVVDGRAIAAKILANCTATCTTHQLTPHLCVLQVGDRQDSNAYIRAKERAARKTSLIQFTHIKLPQQASQWQLLQEIMRANESPSITGVVVQLPLPTHIDAFQVLNAVAPGKDVDAFSVYAAGLMALGLEPVFLPPTPAAILHVLREHSVNLAGKVVAIVGRGATVGLPLSLLMNGLPEQPTVVVCHSKTPDAASLTKQADVVVSAVGKAKLVTEDWIKEGAVVIDVGISSQPAKDDNGDQQEQVIVGDVDFEAVSAKASLITPTPGGIGPITVAKLLENTVKGAFLQRRLTERPK